MVARFLAVLAPSAFFLAIGCGGRTPMSSPEGDGSAGGGGGLEDAPAACTAGTVTFHMRGAAGNSSSYCTGFNCSHDWVTVRTQQDEPMALHARCSTKCDDCQVVGCPAICIEPKRLEADGERLTWDGTYWPEATCGAGQPCRTKRCASPGRYVATMCASASPPDAGPSCAVRAMPKCVDVKFEYPSAAIVEGAI